MGVFLSLRYRRRGLVARAWLGLAVFGATGILCAGRAGVAVSSSAQAGTVGGRERYREGLERFKNGRWDEALACFQDVSRNATGYLQLCATNMEGQIHRINGRPVEAKAVFARMIDQAERLVTTESADTAVKRHAELLKRLGLIWQAEICEEQREWEEAAERYERFLAAYAPEEPGLSPSVAAPNPAIYEKLARLYWRIGRYGQARATFARLLERWPAWERAPLVGVAVLALDAAPPVVREQRLAFLACMMTWPLFPGPPVATQAATSLPGLEGLPDPTEPMRLRLSALMAGLPQDSRFRPLLGMYLGWMWFEAGRMKEAESTFGRAARLTRDRKDSFSRRLHGYAELSRALAMARQDRLAEAVAVVEDVIKETPGEHLNRVASAVIQALHHRISDRKATEKCGVESLK